MLAKEKAGVVTTVSGDQSLYGWRVIDGGLEGSAALGLRHVRFLRPVQVAARGNFIFIVDAGADLLYRYDLARDQLEIILELKGVAAGEVSDLYVRQDHSFYLVDPDAARVLYFDRKGQLVRTFQDRLNLIRPVAVTYDEVMGRVLIADGSSDDVLVFTTTGLLQGVIGSRGLEDGKFLNITAIASGVDGVYVTTRLGHRVQVMGRDGRHLKSFQPNTVVFPLAVAVDSNKNSFVSDYLDNSIKVYRDGLYLESIGGSGSAPGRFKRISDLWYDQGFLYAVDSLNGRIQILRVEMIEPPEREALVDAEEAEIIETVEEVDAVEKVDAASDARTEEPTDVAPAAIGSADSTDIPMKPEIEDDTGAQAVDEKSALQRGLEEAAEGRDVDGSAFSTDGMTDAAPAAIDTTDMPIEAVDDEVVPELSPLSDSPDIDIPAADSQE